MKIHPGDPLPGIPGSVPKAKDGSRSPAFGEVFTKTLHSRPEQVSSIVPAAPIRPPIATSFAGHLYGTTERALDAMERYQRLLGSAGVDLSTVEPAVQELENEIAALEPLMDGVPADDPVLPITRQTLRTAAREIARFYRGDYGDV
ncbi:MAG: hypothetical protein C4519_07570 [Desulfobacteraceae bacterium]|nr:MAG: hypothetical protein C4519_07570 [Desulfobacteraceae bacterium]